MIFDLETTGLNPMDDKIVSVAFILKNGMRKCITLNKDVDTEEELLRKFMKHLREESEIIGFNIDSFDIPFLIKRCLINNIPVPEYFNNYKQKDLRKLANGFWYSYDKETSGKLNDWAEILGIDVETHNGGEIPRLYRKGEYEKIAEHNKEDVKITQKLWERLKNCNLHRS